MKLDTKSLEHKIKEFVVPHGTSISLKKDFKTHIELPGVEKADLKEALHLNVLRLAEQQSKLYAQDRHAILIILQAMDAAGKDGTIKHVMSGLNPQACHVRSFKQPSSEELNHDYLWRCSRALPERGCIGIFNRSYYEEVLITKVHPEILSLQRLPDELMDKGIFKRRYEEINNFEEYLTNNGITILKFFLHISKSEQKKRFLERIDMPEKNWKFSASDAAERAKWDEYQDAYEECFNKTSTKNAPWHVIPADYKPFARLAVGFAIHHAMQKLDLQYPKVTEQQKKELAQAKKMLDAK